MSTQTSLLGHDEYTQPTIRNSVETSEMVFVSTFEIHFRHVTSGGEYRTSDSCTVHLTGLSDEALRTLALELQEVSTSILKNIA